MELVKEIEDTLAKVLDKPSFDLREDYASRVFGYVSSRSFENQPELDSQNLVWKTLKRGFGEEKLVKIRSLILETPFERIKRLSDTTQEVSYQTDIWYHNTPNLKKYWVILGVEPNGAGYRSFYIVINEKDEFHRGLKLNYAAEVVKGMELETDEAFPELYSYIFSQAETEVRAHLIEKYDQLKSEGLWGKENMYNYIFTDFRLLPVKNTSSVLFSKGEIFMIKQYQRQFGQFQLFKKLKALLKQSENVLANSKHFT